MDTSLPAHPPHPAGEQPPVEDWSATVDTFAGRVHVEWNSGGLVTPLGQLPFFIEYLKQAGLFTGWVADCPLTFSSPNAPSKRDLLGTVLLSVLSGHYRYAHITTLRCDAVNPRLLGMRKVVSEDAVRRGLAKIDEAAGLTWLQRHLDYCVWPLLTEPWVLDIDSTIKPLYGRQEGAMVGYNPHKPGRPSHCYHTYLMANLRLVLGVDVQPGDEHTPKHGQAGLWSLLHRLGRSRWPALLRGDVAWGLEPATSCGPAAPQARSAAGAPRSHPAGAAVAQFCRDRAGSGGVGIRCVGDLAGRRAPHAGPVVPRSGRFRERVRRTEEPMGLGRLHDARPEALPAARRQRRPDLQLGEPVRAPG